MTFGLRSCQRAMAMSVQERRGAAATTLPALLGTLAALALLAGCGGGGGGGGGGSNNNNNSNNATITGTVINPLTNSPDTEVVVAFGNSYTTTSNSGTFSLSIPSGTAGSVIFYGKAALTSNGAVILGSNGLPTSVSTNDSNTYEGTGYYPVSSSTQVNLFTTGIPVAAQSSGATVALGSIGLFTANDPPLPPPNF